MITFLFLASITLGILVIGWVVSGFLTTQLFALGITLLIAGVYSIGILELFRYRRTTARLDQALENLPAKGSADFEQWLTAIPAELKAPVTHCVQGSRTGLPLPTVAPYLAGLLIMLGVLGTFAGMVDTLSGAVIALEQSSDLSGIRTGLTAPIKGLGLAFGTSVAGIAASAMLGLATTLCRRERLLSAARLERAANTTFRECTRSYQNQQTAQALHSQSAALPLLAEQLGKLTERITHMADNVGNSLTAQQDDFLTSTERNYRELTDRIAVSIDKNLSANHALAEDSSIRIGTELRVNLEKMSDDTQTRLNDKLVEQYNALSENLRNTQEELSHTFREQTLELSERLLETVRCQINEQNERDGVFLKERQESIEQLSALSAALQQACADQQLASLEVIEQSSATLGQISDNFQSRLGGDAEKIAAASVQLTASSSEMVGVADRFASAMETYNESNLRLSESLQLIRDSLDLSSQRSDEQMGYYIDQAREIVDQSMSSQRLIIEELRQAGQQGDLLSAEAS